ncbi:MAG: caspase family protein [Bacteroidales bacterium]|nr:caspase family protein [Bacteroidales bacterium]
MKKRIIAICFGLLSILFTMAQGKRALIVRISDYGNEREDPNMWANISGANDVDLLVPQFKKQGYKVTSLKDQQATKAAIVKGLEAISSASAKGDIVYLHFSMHGQPVEDMDGDEADGWDEALIPYDAKKQYEKGGYEGQNHLIDDELALYCDRIRKKIGPSGMLYVVLDACHSGSSSRGDDDHERGTKKAFSRSGKLYDVDRTRETNDYFKVATVKGQSPVMYLEACRSYQVNKEVRDPSTNVWYGSLSYYINQIMNTFSITTDTQWVKQVQERMATNPRLRKQNMVIESSK